MLKELGEARYGTESWDVSDFVDGLPESKSEWGDMDIDGLLPTETSSPFGLVDEKRAAWAGDELSALGLQDFESLGNLEADLAEDAPFDGTFELAKRSQSLRGAEASVSSQAIAGKPGNGPVAAFGGARFSRADSFGRGIRRQGQAAGRW
ncbi:MAG: hypothetical protein R3B90_19980 [Planctomycetaceae bacterium]